MLRALALLTLLLALTAPRAGAQDLPPEVPRLSGDAWVSLLTVKPGDQLYSYFGHTAIRVVDPARRLDVVFNYGTFDWGEGVSGLARFLVEFVHGSLDYTLSDAPMAPMRAFWRDELRSVDEQVLDLDPEQVQRVFAFLFDNLRPENRGYRYDFFLDNCTNRSDAALREALGDDLIAPLPDPGGVTFRRGIDPYLVGLPWLHFGMDVLMGGPADAVPEEFQPLFLPDRLQAALETWRVRRSDAPDGAPLAPRTERLYDSGRPDLAPASLDWALLVGWIVFAAGILLGRRPRYLGALYLLAGVVGVAIFGVWHFTLHHVTPNNLNILWAWPTHLIVAAPLLFGRRPGWLSGYLLVAGCAGVVVAVAWAFLPQDLPPAALPLTLAMALGALRQGTVLRAAPETEV